MNEKLEKVREFAFKKHNMPSDCQRYGTMPYSVHLESVVEIATKYIFYVKEEDREDVISACWLHDILEDTDTSPNDIEKAYNRRIADIVLRVSNERGFNRKERNCKTYPKIWENDFAIFVKLCDRISNTRNSKESGHRMYKVYKSEYPTFRYAIKERNLYPEMWKELDELNEYSV
jgi:(p)ppGpp synthase/HD superfamily hydrolase